MGGGWGGEWASPCNIREGTIQTERCCSDVKSTAMDCLISLHVEEEDRETFFCGTQKARLRSRGGSDRKPDRDTTPGKPAQCLRVLTVAWGLGFLEGAPRSGLVCVEPRTRNLSYCAPGAMGGGPALAASFRGADDCGRPLGQTPGRPHTGHGQISN